MNIISRPAIRRAEQVHLDAAEWLENWLQVAKAAQWQNLHDVRVPYPATDQVEGCLVFNVRGNTYRFIVGVRYATSDHGGTLFVKHLMTHAEYNKGTWKRECER